jgi:hypothetical protein
MCQLIAYDLGGVSKVAYSTDSKKLQEMTVFRFLGELVGSPPWSNL